MSSIIRDGYTFHGITEFGVGVFRNTHGLTYAGQQKDGYACGLAVTTRPDGSKEYAEYGPDGRWDGRILDRYADGLAAYRLFERDRRKAEAFVFAGGCCYYNREVCAPDDPRLLALIAQVAPVEVRPAARAPHPPSPAIQTPRSRPMDLPARFAPAGAREGHGHRGASPRRMPSLIAVRHSPTTAAMQPTTRQRRVYSPST